MVRRNFLRMMGLSPLAAKAAIDDSIGRLTGTSTSGMGYYYVTTIPITEAEKAANALLHFNTFGVPKFALDICKKQSMTVNSLDPDIACKKSWSMNVKIMTQRQRNYERRVENIYNSLKTDVGKGTFKKILGFEWPSWWSY